jgi:hypothetical protein
MGESPEDCGADAGASESRVSTKGLCRDVGNPGKDTGLMWLLCWSSVPCETLPLRLRVPQWGHWVRQS